MAKPGVLVDSVSELERVPELRSAEPGRPQPELLSVRFQGGRVGLLDLTVPRSAVWADVLQSRRETKQPAYVEIDPDTNLITELLLPVTVKVGAVTPTSSGDAVEVELIISQARHYLRRENPNFPKLLERLETARKQGVKVLVTETLDGDEIIDVRPLGKPPSRRRR